MRAMIKWRGGGADYMILCGCVCVSVLESRKKHHRSRVVYTVASRFPLWLSKTSSQRNMTDIRTRTLPCVCCALCRYECASCQPANFQPMVQSFLDCGEMLSSTVLNFT